MHENNGSKVCQGCLAKDAEIIILKHRINKLLAKIKHALSIIDWALNELKTLQLKTERVLSKKSGVPRGKWAYIKGMNNLINRVITFINWISEALRS